MTNIDDEVKKLEQYLGRIYYHQRVGSLGKGFVNEQAIETIKQALQTIERETREEDLQTIEECLRQRINQ